MEYFCINLEFLIRTSLNEVKLVVYQTNEYENRESSILLSLSEFWNYLHFDSKNKMNAHWKESYSLSQHISVDTLIQKKQACSYR